MRRAAFAAIAAAAFALSACPLPQPVASVRRENGGTTTPPRVDTSSVVPAEALVKVSTTCPEPPAFQVRANVVDDDTTELVSVRWFVDYAPDALGSRPLFSEEVPGTEDATQTTRVLTPVTLTLGAPFDTAAGAAHVLELVVSNGFYPLYTDGLSLPNRSAQPGFETQVFRWVFQFDPASDDCGS